jgi:hypothetical protein
MVSGAGGYEQSELQRWRPEKRITVAILMLMDTLALEELAEAIEDYNNWDLRQDGRENATASGRSVWHQL